MLAFGQKQLRGDENREARDRLFYDLIEGSTGETRGRVVRFLAMATTEMPDLPGQQAINRLLAVYPGAAGAQLTTYQGNLQTRQTPRGLGACAMWPETDMQEWPGELPPGALCQDVRDCRRASRRGSRPPLTPHPS